MFTSSQPCTLITQIYSFYLRLPICLHLAETLVSEESPALDMSVDLPPAGNVVDDAARYTISIKESVHSEHISIEGSV